MPTPFEVSSTFIDELIVLSPLFATSIGVDGHDHQWDDLSPAGHDARHDIAAQFAVKMASHLQHPDRTQRLAAHVVSEYLSMAIDAYVSGDHLTDLSHMGSPFQSFREIFELTDPADPLSAANAAARLETIDVPLAGYRETLERGLAVRDAVSRRQVEAVLDQIDSLTGPASAWHRLEEGSPIADRMGDSVNSAKAHMHSFRRFLEDTYLPSAQAADGVGRDRYERKAASFLGMNVDADEMYSFGWHEINRLLDEMRGVARTIDPNLDLAGVIAAVEGSAELSVTGAAELVSFVAARQENAIQALDGVHFDVPAVIREVTVQIAPPGGGLGAYYRSPSEDFSRPGGIYYSVGSQTNFPLYQEVSTAYHEGFPGHHLQIGTAMAARDQLSRAHRVLIWYSGYGEGWALYTERLMGELGFFERPEWVLGMLASQLFRAARVVVDIGMHLGLQIPETSPLHGGERWTFEKAVDFMRHVGLQPHAYATSEVTRYLGWPGQAISYKIGEREILRLRDDERRRLGADFDMKAFHSRVLGNGEMGLDLLRDVVSGDFDR